MTQSWYRIIITLVCINSLLKVGMSKLPREQNCHYTTNCSDEVSSSFAPIASSLTAQYPKNSRNDSFKKGPLFSGYVIKTMNC